MAIIEETFQVRGIRCERCMTRLAHVLKGKPGLESANATLAGTVTLAYDDTETSRETLVSALAAGGFRELDPAPPSS